MVPLVNLLMDAIARRSFNILNEYGIPMDDTIAVEISNSDPSTDSYSPNIIEYANTLDITPAQAYQELQLDYKTHHGIKMRTYATTKKYQQLIREVKTQEQSDSLLKEMRQKLILESFI